MILKSFSYTEYDDEPRRWEVTLTEFAQINLLVGKNATGKSRLVAVINSLCRLLTGKQSVPFETGTYDAEFTSPNGLYRYSIQFLRNQVSSEVLSLNGVEKLKRESSGEGVIWYAKENKSIAFQVEKSAIAIRSRNDQLQHPFVHELVSWAEGTALFLFGSDLGKGKLLSAAPAPLVEPISSKTEIGENDAVTAYIRGFETYGTEFDLAILRDMRQVGYELDEVAADQVSSYLNLPVPLVGLVTVESELGFRVPQFTMSQGMYRALALIIHVNLALFSHSKQLLLIDDIGEGLDYERSTKIVNLLINAAKSGEIQLLMTTNDRFVMNEVPLEYWAILERQRGRVSAVTQRNSPELFEEFKYLGLSNFDLFKDRTLH